MSALPQSRDETGTPPMLGVADAYKDADGHDLLTFTCWEAGEALIEGSGQREAETPEPIREEYALEAQEYIRMFALRDAYKTLTFRTADRTLAAVSAFSPVTLPIGRGLDCWHLEVIGVALRFQHTHVTSDFALGPQQLRISEYILRRTYARMHELDPSREWVRARVNEFNYRSIEACRRVGLEKDHRDHGHYWTLMGELNPHLGWTDAPRALP